MDKNTMLPPGIMRSRSPLNHGMPPEEIPVIVPPPLATTQTRATKGGEVGMNGEFYAGGTFLPNTTLTKMTKRTKAAGTRKQRVSEYQWEVAPEGMQSVFAMFPYHPAHHPKMREQVNPSMVDVAHLDRMYALWTAGEKWVAA